MAERKQTTGQGTSTLVVFDSVRHRRYYITNKRIEIAINCVIQGFSPMQFMELLRQHAATINDDHPMWFIQIKQARRILERARQELAKDLASTRAGAYAAQIARLENLYRRAMANKDDKFALSVLEQITQLNERALGVNDGKQDGKIDRTRSKIERAIENLTNAIATAGGAGRETEAGAGEESAGDAVP